MSVTNPERHGEIVPNTNEPLVIHTEAARRIACDLEIVDREADPRELRYFRIVKELKEHDLFAVEVARVKRLFSKELAESGLTPDEDVWEMLTVMELFDPETANHCINTYYIARSKIENQLSTGIILANYFKKEGVDANTFFVSCLLHDIGKIEVPHSVVVNKVNDSDCSNLLFEHIDDILLPALKTHLKNDAYTLPEGINTGETLLSYLHETLHVRPQMLTPIRLLLGHMDNRELDEVEKQLAHCNCSLNDSLITIMRKHDAYSQEILARSGRRIEAILAGSHHVTRTKGAYVITVGTLQVTVDLAHIIHLADVENAILGVRHYKSGQTPLEALKILAIHAKQGLIDSYISYLWIADELYKKGASINPPSEKEKTNYAFVVDFLNTQLEAHPTYPDWKVITDVIPE